MCSSDLATVNNWRWCSMHAAHVIDNRSKFTSLKFQVYVNFGIGDYDSSVSKYLKGKDPTRPNRIDEAPIEELLMYCGLDSLFCHRLALKQMEVVG